MSARGSDVAAKAARQIQKGTALPELKLYGDPTFIISTALATRDFQDVHHDRDKAQAKGSKDIFVNILTDTGLVQRYVTDWAGPNAVLKRVAIKLGAPNFPGDTMKMTGVVKGKEEATGIVDLEVVGKNSWGNHVTAQVRVALPAGA